MRYAMKISAAAVVAALYTPSYAEDGKEWWVIVGYVDHQPFVWDDAVLPKANRLTNQLAACGLVAFWDFSGKFEGLGTKDRGTVIVISSSSGLTKAVASGLLAAARPCVPDAYIKRAHYTGE